MYCIGVKCLLDLKSFTLSTNGYFIMKFNKLALVSLLSVTAAFSVNNAHATIVNYTMRNLLSLLKPATSQDDFTGVANVISKVAYPFRRVSLLTYDTHQYHMGCTRFRSAVDF